MFASVSGSHYRRYRSFYKEQADPRKKNCAPLKLFAYSLTCI